MTISPVQHKHQDYSAREECRRSLQKLLHLAHQQIPDEVREHVKDVTFSAADGSNAVHLPSPFKNTEALSALKAVEACVAAAIADLRYAGKRRKIDIDTERSTCFLFSAYLSTVDGMDKANPEVRKRLKGQLLSPEQQSVFRY